ncbi:MAG: mono/diheme cytochrome c family protein [Paracoccaceae bacterium]|jgi:mono/diheme cytochrome c family protein
MNKISIAGLGAIGIAIGAVAVAQQNEATAGGEIPYGDPSAVARGGDIYDANCVSCHGANLEGQAEWRTARSPEGRALAPPHDETGHTWHHPDEQLFAITKFGTAALVGGDYESDMSGYEDVLSDTDIREVLAYIKSTWPAEVIAQHNKINAQ